MNFKRTAFIRLICLLVIPAAAAFAQFDSAAVLGTISDPGAGVISTAKVALTNTRNGVVQSAQTDASGTYQFLNVRVGTYTLKAEQSGFKTTYSEPFQVTVNARQRVDLTLQVGAVSEEVTVNAAAGALEADTSDRGTVVQAQQIVDLPLNGRSYADLTLLSPGVRKSVLENGSISSRDASYNVNGQRSALNNFILDGVDNNAYGTSNQGFSNQVVQISPDAVQEYRVQINNYSAEFGRAAGAVINASSRSGSNTFHGSAWEFLRNTQLNAVGFFAPTGGVKPTFIQNQFGASFGGPIRKDSTFFFADYEGLERVSRTLQFASVPTLAQRAGNLGTSIRNPVTGVTYADGVIPASAVSPFAQAVLNGLPAPNLPGVSNNFSSLPRDSISDKKGDARLDEYLNSKVTAFFRYSHRVADIFAAPSIPGSSGGNNNGFVRIVNQQMAFGNTYILGSKAVLEARLGVTWSQGGKTPIGQDQPSLLQKFGIGGLPTDPKVVSALNSQSVSGWTAFGRQGSNPQFQNPFVINPKVNYSRIMGRHSMKIGYEHQRIDTAVDDFNPVYGSDGYSGQFSKPAGGTSPSGTYNLADFMFGARSSYELNNYVIVDLRQRMHFAYVQDDFKINRKLTLNAGLRWEFATPQWEKDNKLANFDPTTNTLIQAKAGSLYDRALVNPRYDNFAPRIGFAYNIMPKTVIRSAYGISFVQFNRMGGENLLSYNGPNIVDAQVAQDITKVPVCTSLTAPPASCFRLTQQGYPENFAVPANFNPLLAAARYIPKDNQTGYVQGWHFTIQRELPMSTVLEVAYVGNKGTHLMILGDQNQARVNNAGENASLQSRRPIQNFAAIEVAFDGGFSSYHGFQAKLEKRFTKGLTFINSFTWSKALDNASGHLEANNGDNSRVNYRKIANDKGYSSYDQKFNNTLSFVWELPFGKGRQFGSGAPMIAQTLLGGWTMTGINTNTTGLPVNMSYSPTAAFQVSGYPTYRPNFSGDPLAAEGLRTIDNYFNKANVSVPTNVSQPFGNAGRNPVRSFGFYQMDLGLHKQFNLFSETRKLEFRAEAFNLTNKTNFGAPDGNVSNGSFGTIRSTFPARQLQFAMKFLF